MNKNEILEVIKSLSHSQGLYGRVLRYIQECPEYLDELESQNFRDTLDLIYYIEC